MFCVPLLGCNVLLSTDDYATGTPHPCGPTEIPLHDVCIPIGPSCDPASMVADAERMCVPLLPPEDCPAGEVALPGRASCEPLAPECADDPSALIEDPQTIVVATEGCSDTASPFCTISDAVRAAPDGGLVVIAEGTYRETVLVDRPLRLRGVCPTSVTIERVTIASESEVRAVELTHTEVRGTQATLREVWMHGMRVDRAHVRMRRALIDNAVGGAITATDSELELTEVHIRDVLEDPALLAFGRGIWARTSAVTLSSSHIQRATDAGVLIEEGSADITATVVRDIQPSPARSLLGATDRAVGIAVDNAPLVTITSTVIDTTRDAGISLRGVEARIEETVVRRTRSADKSCAGHGVRALGTALEPTRVVIERSLIEGSEEAGVHVMGAEAALSDSLVRITASTCGASETAFGDGVTAYSQPIEGSPARVTLDHTRVDTNARSGVLAFGDADVQITSSLLQDNGASGSAALVRAAYTPEEGLGDHEPRIALASVEQCAHRDARPFPCPIDGGDVAHVTPSFLPRAATGESAPTRRVVGPLTSVGFALPEGTVAVWGRDHLAAARTADGRFDLRHLPNEAILRLSARAPDHAAVVAQLVSETMPLVIVPLDLLHALTPPWSDPSRGAALLVASDATGNSPGAVRFRTEPPKGLTYLSGTAISQAPTSAAMAFIPNLSPGPLHILAEPLAAPSCSTPPDAVILPTEITLATFRCPPE